MADVTIRPSYQITLKELEDIWSQCQSCELGVSRIQVGGSFVFGEGSLGGVMFIGEGPGKTEEEQGRPFIGKSGLFLRKLLKELQFNKYYITNSVCCRSWDFAYDSQGNRRTRENRRAKKTEYVIDDKAPKPSQTLACKPRLIQQIYKVDPVLIVTLGGSAAESLLGRSVKTTVEGGKLTHVHLPGAGFIPQLTPKGAWARNAGQKGSRHLIAPVAQNKVTYPVVPLLHPAYAQANEADKRDDSPMRKFISGLQLARNIYASYMQEVYGEQFVQYELSDESISNALEENYAGSDYD